MKRATHLRHLLGLALAAVMLSGVVLAGCGGGGDDDAAAPANAAKKKDAPDKDEP